MSFPRQQHHITCQLARNVKLQVPHRPTDGESLGRGLAVSGYCLVSSTGSRPEDFSSCDSRALEDRLSSRGAPALLLRGLWDLPGPGVEPASPALVGGLFTTEPPGKPNGLTPDPHAGGTIMTLAFTDEKTNAWRPPSPTWAVPLFWRK